MPSRPPVHRPPGWQPFEARKQSYERQRGTSTARGYDAAWRKLRSQFLQQHPACSHPGCTLPATDVDHIVSIRDRPDLRLDWSNLRPYCHAHHSARTARDQGWGRG
jgi:5-methylcytosine-specific restriction endonuclease McrA